MNTLLSFFLITNHYLCSKYQLTEDNKLEAKGMYKVSKINFLRLIGLYLFRRCSLCYRYEVKTYIDLERRLQL